MLLVPIVAAAALVAGCTGANPGPAATPTPTSNGEDAKSPDAIIADAIAALNAAKSVHAKGTVAVSTLTLDIDLVYANTDLTGTVTDSGTTAQVIKVGSDVYIKAPTSLYATFVPADQQPLLAVLDGKWAKISSAFVSVALPAPLTIDTLVKPATPLTKGSVTSVNGTPAIAITDANKVEYDVSLAPGPAYLLQVKSGANSVALSDFDKTTTIQAPDPTQVVDILHMLGLS
jgi:hypothetical protein